MDRPVGSRHGHKRILTGILIACCGLSLFSLLITSDYASAVDPAEPPEEVEINNTVYPIDRKGPVWFTHAEHADGYVESCDGCHHDYQGGKNVWQEGQVVQKCAACHDPATSRGRNKKLNIAYHKNCKGCHRELARDGGTEAPYRQCTDCHAKR